MIIELIVFTVCITLTISATSIRKDCVNNRNPSKTKEYIKYEDEQPCECSICLEEMVRGDEYFLECGHSFHERCIKQWFCKCGHRRCPICDH